MWTETGWVDAPMCEVFIWEILDAALETFEAPCCGVLLREILEAAMLVDAAVPSFYPRSGCRL